MPEKSFRLLFVGDVVGRPGRRALTALLAPLRQELAVDLAVVNGENSAGGAGITAETAAEILSAGADVITTGNHVWDQKQFAAQIGQLEQVVRPANYPPGTPGEGSVIISAAGAKVLVMNLQGRVFMPPLDDPFRAADAILAEHPQADIVICDI
ncbi:MAG: YmdB family metallophosphoesterase, partial [Candidatus Dormibacteraceae bacterium]